MIAVKWNVAKLSCGIVYHYYYILVAIYTLSIFFPVIRTGVTMSLILLYLFSSSRFVRTCTFSTSLVFFYLIYCVLSVQGYIYNGMPISIYFADLSTQVLPTIFFFISFNQQVDKERFYKSFIIAILLAIVIGLYFYIYNPSAYIQYIVKTANTAYEGGLYVNIQRFNSIFGSTIMGSFSVFMLIIVIYNFWKIKKMNYCFFFYILLYLLSLISAMLTQQRSSMVLSIASIIVFFLSSFAFKIKISKPFVLFNIILIVSIINIFFYLFQDFFDLFIERIVSIDSAFDERDQQWIETFKHSQNLIFGTGLGSVGHQASAYTNYIITDGGFFKIAAEFGIMGILIFLLIVALCIISKLRFFPHLFREYMIVIVCLAQSTGSNTLMFQQVLPMFWFSLGIIVSYSIKNKHQHGNNRILFAPVSPD